MSKYMKIRRASSNGQESTPAPLQRANTVSSVPSNAASPKSTFSRSRWSTSSSVQTPLTPPMTSPLAESSGSKSFARVDEEPPSYFESTNKTKFSAGGSSGKTKFPAEKSGSKAEKRLHELAEELKIDLSSNLEEITLQIGPQKYASVADEASAQKLLNDRRMVDPEYKTPSGISKITKSKAKMAEFSYKEINRALTLAALSPDADLGTVDALLSMGGSVDIARRASTNVWKKMTKNSQEDQRNNVLQQATRSASPEMVQLLAGHADQQTLDESLSICIEAGDLKKIRALLQYDADVSAFQSEFMAAVAETKVEVVGLLLGARKGPDGGCRAAALVEAVRRGSLPMINDLLRADASTKHEDARALKEAVAAADVGAVLAIAASSAPPTALQLDEACDISYRNRRAGDTCRLQMLEMCLCAGARGPLVETLMQDAADEGWVDAVSLLLRYGVSIDKDEGRALCIAVESEAEEIFNIMMDAPADATTLGNALVSSCSAIRLGLTFVTALLKRRASVDFRGGAPLVAAVSQLRNDILLALISRGPSKSSLAAALASSLLLAGDVRLSALALILPIKPPQDALDASLVTLVAEHSLDYPAIKALLFAHASPDARSAEAVKIVARRHDTDALEVLAENVSWPEITYSRAAGEVAKTNWRQPKGLSTLQWLLERDADPVELELGMVEAAVQYDLQALSFLADYISSADAYTLAFTEAVADDGKWLKPSGLQVVQLLLEKGANGTMVDTALAHAVQSFLQGSTEEILVDTLLQHNANVNTEDGLPFQLAIEAGNTRLLRKLYEYSPTARTLSSGITWALIHGLPVDTIIETMDILATGKGEKADMNYVYADLPPIFLAMQHYRHSDKLARHMCHLGCEVDTTIDFKLFGDYADTELVAETAALSMQRYQAGGQALQIRMVQNIDGDRGNDFHEWMVPPEKATALIWACCQVEHNEVSASVVEVLLRFRADINFRTTHSRSSPLLLASRYKRPDLVSILVKHKPEASVKDKFNRSALCYAAANGDRETVKAVLQLKPRVNDGSLHEAARELHSEVMSQLLRAGHDANFTSTKHDGLTPLGVLSMYCDGTGDISRIEDCVDALVKYKVEAMKKWNGKTVLYLAMDNPNAVPVTSAVVERLMYRHLNNPANVYSEDHFHYSPSMYLEKGNFAGSESSRQSLLRLLQGQGAEDVYFVDGNQGYQPDDACGMPPALLRAEQKRQEQQARMQAEWEWHEAEMERKNQLQQQYLEHQDQLQVQRLEYSNEMFEQRQYHRAQQAIQQYRIQDANNRQAIAFRMNMAQQKAIENFHQIQHRKQQLQVDAIGLRNKVAANHQLKTRNEYSVRHIAGIKMRSAHPQMMMNKHRQAESVRTAYENAAVRRRITY